MTVSYHWFDQQAKQWSKLENHYEVKSLANKLFLRKSYFTATMSGNDKMMEHKQNEKFGRANGFRGVC